MKKELLTEINQRLERIEKALGVEHKKEVEYIYKGVPTQRAFCQPTIKRDKVKEKKLEIFICTHTVKKDGFCIVKIIDDRSGEVIFESETYDLAYSFDIYEIANQLTKKLNETALC
jgi:hypothetical protein